MQTNINVMIVEDDPSVCRSFAECFEKTDGITLVKTTASVPDALLYVREHRPDAVILDLELHSGVGNGISFLTSLRQMPASLRPYVLVNTNNSSQTTYDMVRALGAGFVMYKHQEGYSPEGVAEILLAMSVLQDGIPLSSASAAGTFSNAAPAPTEEESQKQLIRRICAALDSVSISPRAVGYRYLTEAIEIFVNEPVTNVSLIIGRRHGKTEASVERAMQNAIGRAWASADIDKLLSNYTAHIHSKKGIPTVTEFICYFANKIKNEL